MDRKNKESGPADFIGGSLNLLGLKIDLGELLNSQENLKERLEGLREKLKAAGGKETLSDEMWKSGGVSVSGHISTRGILGDREFHLGAVGKPTGKGKPGSTAEAPEVVEPPVDVFDEEKQITIIADVPGASLEDLELKAEGKLFSLTARKSARRNYHKEVRLRVDVEPDSLKATCRNGILEVHLRKLKSGK